MVPYDELFEVVKAQINIFIGNHKLWKNDIDAYISLQNKWSLLKALQGRKRLQHQKVIDETRIIESKR